MLIQFDATYLDGPLAGLLIPGQTVSAASREDAARLLRFYSKVAAENDFIRAAGSGHRYQVSNVRMHA